MKADLLSLLQLLDNLQFAINHYTRCNDLSQSDIDLINRLSDVLWTK